MNNITVKAYSLLAALLLLPTFAFGAVNMTGVSGVWSSVTGGQYVTGETTSSIMWGAKTTYRSGYKFTAASPSAITLGNPFSLGTFTHMNQLIPLNTAISAATLTTSLSLNIDGTPINQVFNFNFLHNETPNIIGTCPAGSASICDDVVTLTNNSLITKDFIVKGKTYQFTLLGFQYNNQLLQSFLTKEKFNNSAILKAVITLKDVPVPEPSTYLIMGSVLLGCAYLKSRKSRENRGMN